MRRGTRRILIVAAVLAPLVALLTFAGYGNRYPYGWSHHCDTILSFALSDYAEKHDG